MRVKSFGALVIPLGISTFIATLFFAFAGDEDPRRGLMVVDEAALEDVRKMKENIELKEKDLAAREGQLKIREQLLADQLNRLEKIRQEIGEIEQVRKAQNEEKIQQLTDTLIKMSPKAAAKMLSTLDEVLATRLMAQMESQKLAKILNIMDAARSSRLSENIAGTRKPLTADQKGGQSHDESSSSIARASPSQSPSGTSSGSRSGSPSGFEDKRKPASAHP